MYLKLTVKMRNSSSTNLLVDVNLSTMILVVMSSSNGIPQAENVKHTTIVTKPILMQTSNFMTNVYQAVMHGNQTGLLI